MEAICYLTCNRNTTEMERRYNLLPNDENYKSFILSDKKDNLAYNIENTIYFSFKDYLNLDTILRQTYISLVDFYFKYPDFKNYWLLEDDVIFKGSFLTFFDFYKEKEEDFIVLDYGVDLSAQGEWLKSPYNKINGPFYTDVPVSGGLSVISRYSNKLLKELCYLTSKGTYGHTESFPHTVCVYNGFNMYSMKNDGFFDTRYCDWHHNWESSDLINIPENKLIHAVKF